MISFLQCIIFEQISYSEWPLEQFFQIVKCQNNFGNKIPECASHSSIFVVMSDPKEMDEIEIDLTSTDFQVSEVSVNSLDPSGNKKLHLVLVLHELH